MDQKSWWAHTAGSHISAHNSIGYYSSVITRMAFMNCENIKKKGHLQEWIVFYDWGV